MKGVILLLLTILQLFKLNAQDVTAPALVSLNISPQIVDITNGPAQVTVTLGVTDDISGVAVMRPNIVLPNGSFQNGPTNLISGTNLNGVWQRVFTIPQFTQTGEATLDRITSLRDNAGNEVSFLESDLINLGFDTTFEIIDGNTSDVTAPELVSLNISPQVVDITNGPAQVTVTLGVTDDMSGVAVMRPNIVLPNGSFQNGPTNLISGTNLDGVWQRVFTIPQLTQTGEATLDRITSLRDNAGNEVSFLESDLINLGFDITFEIIDGNTSDVTAPALVSLNISPQVVDITNGPAQVTVTLGVTDDISGVAVMRPNIVLPNGSFQNGPTNLISGTNLNGIWQKVFTIPQFTQTGEATLNRITSLRDNAGNEVSFLESDLINLGFDITFEIIDGNTNTDCDSDNGVLINLSND